MSSSPGFVWPIEPQNGAIEKDPSQQDDFNFGNIASKVSIGLPEFHITYVLLQRCPYLIQTYDQADLSTSFHDEYGK